MKKILLIVLLLAIYFLSGCCGPAQCAEFTEGCLEGCLEGASNDAEAEQCYDGCCSNPLTELLCGKDFC